MAKYNLELKIQNSKNQTVNYSVDLTGSYQNHPDDYFRGEENRLHLFQAIQDQSTCQVSQEKLKRLIYEWIQEIKEGRRHTTITLDLPPESISTPKPTSVPTTIPEEAKPSQVFNDDSTSNEPDSNLAKPKTVTTPDNSSTAETKIQDSTTSIEAATNKVDDF